MLEVALLYVNMVWIYKLCRHIHIVCIVLKYSKQETLLVAMFMANIV